MLRRNLQKMRMKVKQEYAFATVGKKEVTQLQQAILENGFKCDLALLAYAGFRASEALAIKLEDCKTIFQTNELIIEE